MAKRRRSTAAFTTRVGKEALSGDKIVLSGGRSDSV